MKKTVSVNIRGLNFIIEEDAYELLQNYLDRLSFTLKNEQGSREIIEDIELRIAELCSQKLSANKSVIELADIQDIITTMGDPSQYLDEDNTEGEPHFSNERQKEEPTEKRLFRDTENAVIAGVCSGIASFFKIDVVIIRAIFVIMFFFAGFGFPLYLILWVIVPKTRSTIDRLRMKGKPITVESVREEVESAAENINKGSKKFANQLRNDDRYSRSLNRGVRLLATLFGAGLIFFGILMLIPFLIFIIGGFEFIPVANEQGFLSFPEFGKMVLANGSDYTTMSTGILLLSFSVITFMILLGSMFVFNIKNKWTKLTLLLLFFTGITGGILTGVAGINTGKDFVKGSETEINVGDLNAQTLYIMPSSGELSVENGKEKHLISNSGIMEIENNNVKLYGVTITYTESPDSLFHVRERKSARARSSEIAIKRCDNIKYKTNLIGDSLLMDTYYTFPTTDKLRDQEVEVNIEIPKGGTVRIKDRIITLDSIQPSKPEENRSQRGQLRADGRYDHHD